MTRDARAALVSGVFGLVFVEANAGALPAPWAAVLRALGGLAMLALVAWLVTRGDRRTAPDADPRALRTYLVAVGLEVLAIPVGSALLTRSGHAEAVLPWVTCVVGVHFLPLARAFRLPVLAATGGALLLLGVVGGALALGGAGEPVVRTVSGVLPGVVLMVAATTPGWPPRGSSKPHLA